MKRWYLYTGISIPLLAGVAGVADDTGLHARDKELNEVIRCLEHDSCLAIEWFENNYMKLNKDKCKILFAGHKFEHVA